MANNTRFLSIIIPCYNVADYLIGTIDSLRNLKDAEDCEFIFINDGSTDNTLTIIQDFEKQDNRVRVINQKNAGVSAARNAALKIAKGKYFIPLDGDDKLQPSAGQEATVRTGHGTTDWFQIREGGRQGCIL